MSANARSPPVSHCEGCQDEHVTDYALLARFYDEFNGDPESRSRQVLDSIARYLPATTSVLELGCGTGAILAGLGSGLELTGVDLSPEMLAYAKRRCPHATLHQADMTSFSMRERFDVVVCIFDTVNHVTHFDGWLRMFERVREHLREGGLFIFDLTTLGRLAQLRDGAPWVQDFDEGTLIMDVDFDGEALAQWDVRVFERHDDGRFELHHERIVELGVSLERVRAALVSWFDQLEECDESGGPPTDESERAYFVYRRR